MQSSDDIKAVLFDLDGTVLDTNELIFSCLDYATNLHRGIGFPRQLLENNVGQPLADLFRLVCEPGDGDAAVEAMVQTYRRHQEKREASIVWCAGMDVVLRELLQRGVRLAIVTTKMRAVATRQLARVGLHECFETVVGFDECTRPKPDPEPFRLALDRLAIDASQAVAVGDSAADILGARAAGVTAFGATWGCFNVAALQETRPDRLLATPAELLALVC